MRVGLFLLGLAGLSLTAPSPLSATPGFVVLSAPRGFTVLGTVENFHPGHQHRNFYGAAAEDTALLTAGSTPRRKTGRRRTPRSISPIRRRPITRLITRRHRIIASARW